MQRRALLAPPIEGEHAVVRARGAVVRDAGAHPLAHLVHIFLRFARRDEAATADRQLGLLATALLRPREHVRQQHLAHVAIGGEGVRDDAALLARQSRHVRVDR